ncbi:hypothetical protein [Flavobacterium sp.]|uniref:hypothetical protein n=1 Tax=Flavobacterium sp. TaxID=239 RepID=UPI00262B87F9|nr:hypothetical protein [Flavobacterium sp.]
MQRYLIERTIDSASGTQVFYIDSTSEAEALRLLSAGAGNIYTNQCEVTSLGEPRISGTTSLEDFGEASKYANANHVDKLISLLRDISGTLHPAAPMKERILETLAEIAA